jgi:tRNA (Thr-GGU) A37 N-methylase
VESVKGRTVIISGADIVDGSPVVDIKPYIPFCEAIHDAVAPEWVQVGRILLHSAVRLASR